MLEKFFQEITKIFDSQHPFMTLMHEMLSGLLEVWKYPVFITSDKHNVLVSNIVIGVILLLFGIKLAKYLSKMLHRKLSKTLEASVVNSLERLAYYFFIIIIAIFVLDIANVPLTAFTVIGTTLALGVGLGSQNIANNFISGIIIMVERPIRLGDTIEIKGIVGKVMNIGARCISIRTDKNINILVPNSSVLQDMIINWTLEDSVLQTSLNYKLEMECALETFDEIILSILKDYEYILKNPAPKILLKDLYSNGYEFEVSFSIDLNSPKNVKQITNDINRALLPIFRRHNIKVIDPYQYKEC